MHDIYFIHKVTILGRLQTKEGDPQIKLRIPVYLKMELTRTAYLNGRSLTAEILYRLKHWNDR